MKKLNFLAILTLVVASVVSFKTFAGDQADDTLKAEEVHPYTVVTADQLKTMIDGDEKVVVIDSRGGKYFDGEVITGASQLDVSKTDEEHLQKLGANKETSLVFYCTNVNCPASAKAASKAASLGFTKLYKYPGGIDEWKEKGLPTTKL